MVSPSSKTVAVCTAVLCLSQLATGCGVFSDTPANHRSTGVQVRDRDDGALQRVSNGMASAVSRTYLDVDALEADAPDHYTVVRGDTLWDIADRFLREPWRWTELWSYNPQIHNPHLIYPGDVLALEYINGTPTLVLTRDGSSFRDRSGEPQLGAANPRTRLSPRIRSESLDNAIPTIGYDVIRPFLIHPRIVDDETLAQAPYVLANRDRRLISSLGSQLYVRGRVSRNQSSYGVYRQHKQLKDPTTGEILGHEMLHVADATLLNIGDPSTLTITRNRMETIEGDIILPNTEDSLSTVFTPRVPEITGQARIISLIDAIAHTGRNQVVVINLGSRSSIKEGDVLAIEAHGRTVTDKRSATGWDQVRLPDTRTGVMMVFKTFEKVSYALVMESTHPVTVNDIVTGI